MKVLFNLKFNVEDVDSNDSVESLLFDLESANYFEKDLEIDSSKSDDDILSIILKESEEEVSDWLNNYINEADQYIVSTNFDSNEVPGGEYITNYVDIIISVEEISFKRIVSVSEFV